MKFLRATAAKILFHLGGGEKNLLLHILGLYPRVPAAHHRASKSGELPDAEETQRLLEEALTEQRKENKERLDAFISDATRFARIGEGWQLALSTGEMDWLLQVLNDVRVGSWINLGSPEPTYQLQSLNEKTALDFRAMELAGYFQCRLLEGQKAEISKPRRKRSLPHCSVKCLGTGDGWPSADRNHASFLYQFGHERVLIDCGEGLERSYKASGLSYDAIDALFISHLHADHVGSFFIFMQGLWLEGRRRKLRVYMPKRAIAPVKKMLRSAFIFEELLKFPLEFVPLRAGESVRVKGTKITPFRTSHLDGFRKRFQKKYGGDFTALGFLLEHKGVRVGHSADLGKPEDLEPLFKKPLDLLVCELAHFQPEQIIDYLKGKPVKRVAFVHIGRNCLGRLPEVRRLVAEHLPDIEVTFPNDGQEIRF